MTIWLYTSQCQLRDRMGRIDLQEVCNWERQPFVGVWDPWSQTVEFLIWSHVICSIPSIVTFFFIRWVLHSYMAQAVCLSPKTRLGFDFWASTGKTQNIRWQGLTFLKLAALSMWKWSSIQWHCILDVHFFGDPCSKKFPLEDGIWLLTVSALGFQQMLC